MYMERFRLDGRRAAVTGGGRGIGAEICKALSEAGAHVIVLDLNGDAAARTADALNHAGRKAEAHQVDLVDSAAVSALANKLEGEAPIDVLVNNAGVFWATEALETTDDTWHATMRVNSDAVFWCSRAFAAHMVKRRAGCIVNIGSMCGSIVTRPQNSVPYMTSKGAVQMMTKSLACALAEANVRVNAVAPGYVETEMVEPMKVESPHFYEKWLDMTPMHRLAKTAEIASAVLFLASDASSYCTGTILAVDGGYTAW